MGTARDYGLRNAALAAELLAHEIELTEHDFEWAAFAWDEMVRLQDLAELAQFRTAMRLHAAAAYGLRDSNGFARACDTLLEYGVSKAAHLVPGKVRLAVDLGYALCRGRPAEARRSAAAILASGDDDAASKGNPVAFQGTVLAYLLDLDYARAESAAHALAQACEAKLFSRHDAEIALAWAQLATGIARRSSVDASPVVERIAAAMRREVERQLQRWRRGNSIEPLAEQFWNWPLTALLAMAEDLGIDMEAPTAMADFEWTRAAR